MKKIISFAIVIAMAVVCLPGCATKKDGLIKVRLNEVAHSIFYAPQYVAMELGYFKDEGLNIQLTTGFGADKTMNALLSGSADIGFMGSESSIYAYMQGADDYAVNFAQLTQRAGNFLVAREPITDFTWDMLKERTVLGGRPGGMPEMILEYILKKNGIDPSKDLSIVQNIDFGLTAGAFSGGQGDFTVEFEPGATALELEGVGYVVASLGIDSGFVPYTAYCARKSYIESHEDVIERFTRALERGMHYVNTHPAEDTASIIAPQFADTSVETIAIIVDRYKSQNSWKTDSHFEKEAFDLLCDILKEAGELEGEAPYDKLVRP